MCGMKTQPRWGWTVGRGDIPRVGATRQPWALGRNPVGIPGRMHAGIILIPPSRLENVQTPGCGLGQPAQSHRQLRDARALTLSQFKRFPNRMTRTTIALASEPHWVSLKSHARRSFLSKVARWISEVERDQIDQRMTETKPSHDWGLFMCQTHHWRSDTGRVTRPSFPIHRRGLGLLGGVLLLTCGAVELPTVVMADGVATHPGSVPLAELGIEELVNVEITSVSKKSTPLYEAPAAVAVLTPDDFRRLGATSIPEALRAVPGLSVARLNANAWAISSRGFNDEYASELLVLMDGRSVYTPSFGGVYWNVQDLVLEDLDRIEVIRGPGATLWGANAVNGVINIITKSAKETQGTLLSTSFGTEDQPSVSARYGGRLASNLYYRVYAKYFDREGFANTLGQEMRDDWQVGRGGARLDWEPSEENRFTLIGDYYGGTYGEPVSRATLFPPTNVLLQVEAPMSGGFGLGRWQRQFSAESELKLQMYFDHYERDHPFGGAAVLAGPDYWTNERRPGETRDTGDLDLQHRFILGDRQDLVWGAGYRYTEDHFSGRGAESNIVPDHRADQLFSAFLQDEIALVRDRLRLTLGSKFEHNDYTGLEVQPGVRLLWMPTARQSVWASVARAVRTPTRFETGIQMSPAAVPPALIRVYGNPALTSEKLLAYEIGYRVEPTSRLSFDLTGFYNQYEDVTFADPGSVRVELNPTPHVVVPFSYGNRPPGHNLGAEGMAQWLATDHWRLSAGYSWLRSAVVTGPTAADDVPSQQFHLRSSLDLTHGWEFNSVVYWIDRIAVLSADLLRPMPIAAYARLDLGLSWRPNPHLELAVWGQNLLDDGHPEFASYKTLTIVEIPRTLSGRITWRF